MSSPSLLVTLTAVLVGILAASTANGLHLSHNKVSEFLEKSALESQELARNNEDPGTRWAVLIAGSNGYWNYRHQADVCHAYQLLREGGLKDENIVVFMYDDIANSEENLDRGKLFNRPGGPDVYKGVPKDYTGEQVTANNFYAAILGNRSAITGGSGKVVDSGPNDHIFIYYSDHGGGGAIGMPVGAMVYAADLNKVLKQKHALGSYKQLVFYLEACESGSMFEGLLPKGLDIYAITAANAHESSWAYYCPADPSVGTHYTSCLGDLFSIAWMEDVEGHERKSETFEQDYEVVKNETAHPPVPTYEGSHVLRFGDINLSRDHLDLFMGEYDGSKKRTATGSDSGKFFASLKPVRQHEADLVHFRHKVRAAPRGSEQELRAQRELDEILEHRDHIDNSMARIGSELFGVESMNKLKSARREAGRPVVDDWDCLKSLVREFETHCGSMAQYGLRHMRYLANLCNVGVNTDQMSKVSARVCTSVPKSRWSSLARGFSA